MLPDAVAWFEQMQSDRGVIAHGLVRAGDRRSLLDATAGMRAVSVLAIDLTDVGSIDRGGVEALLAVLASLDSADALIELRIFKDSATATAIARASLDRRKGFRIVYS